MLRLVFKKHFWFVNVLFIVAASLLLARAVNALLVEPLVLKLALPLPTASRMPQPASPVAEVISLSCEAVSAVAGVSCPKEPVITEAPPVDMNADPVKTSLRLKLLGTLLSGVAEWSIASIQDVNTNRVATYMVGDEIQGAQVLEIERLRVVILNNGRKEFIDGNPGEGAPVAMVTPVMEAPKAAAPQPGGGSGIGSTIKATSENTYEVPRKEIDATLSNLNDVAMQARIVPHFKDGQAQGFKLFSVRQDSIYTKIGIQNGDVIRRINGYEMNSPEKALEVYTKLKEASQIQIEVERNGALVKKTYNIR